MFFLRRNYQKSFVGLQRSFDWPICGSVLQEFRLETVRVFGSFPDCIAFCIQHG